MRIAYIVEPRKVIGGGVRAAMNLVRAMSEYYGEEAVIFGTYKGTVSGSRVNFHEVGTLNPFSIAYMRALRRFLKVYRPDVVHCLGLYSALLLVLYRCIYGNKFKIVCTVHRVTMNMRFHSIMKAVIPFIAKRLDFTTFLTGYQQRHYFEKIGFKPKNYIIVPNVIYVEHNSEEAIKAKRQELLKKVDADDITCYVGRIIPSKNIEDTIRLIGILNRRGLKIGAILVGGCSDEYHEKLMNIAKEENVENKVHFEGYVNNPTLYISASTTTTHGEALPNLMVESFALGKVIFSSDIPQMVDLINNGENGFTHSLNDLDGFADDMERVYTDKELRMNVEKNALKTYHDTYEPHTVASKYHDVYAKQ